MSAHLLTSITYIFSAITVLINASLIFLILRQKPRKRANMFLVCWMIFFTVGIPIIGSLIIASRDPRRTLFLIQYLGSPILGLVGFFYPFVLEFLRVKGRERINRVVIFYAIFLFTLSLIKPDILVRSVEWDETLQFYVFVLNPWFYLLAPPTILFCGLGVLKLFKAYQKSRSAMERNRLKYLLLGAIFPTIGLIMTMIPPFQGYPTDLLGVMLSTVCLSYGILRYKLLDISIVIKKGLLYSILTLAITITYLSFVLFLQFIFHGPKTLISFPAIISTALLVALVFQPLQAGSQRVIDRIFFRRKYDPQKLIATLSQVFSKSLDLELIASTLIDQACETLQIGMGVLFLVDAKTNQLRIMASKNVDKKFFEFSIALDSPLMRFISQAEGPQLKYALQEQDVSLEPLEELDIEIFIPLRMKEQLRGVLALGPKLSGEYYTLEELALLETIANSATLAIDNASLYNELLESKKVLEVRVQARTQELRELNEKLEEEVRQRTKELEQKVKELEKFYKLTVGRELKMLELKQRLKESGEKK